MRISPATMGDSSILLELAASDDLVSFRRAVEVEKVPVDVPAAWYGRWCSSSPKLEMRTPLMIASLYGSVSVLQYILSNPSCSRDFDVSRRCGSDSSSALHLAIAGGSDESAKVVKLLLDAGADVNAVDSGGNKAVDLIPCRKPSLGGKTKSAVEFSLRGGDWSLKEDDEEVGSPATPKQNIVSPGGEKKEYPVDVTQPDIKSGIYGTDEFRMYTFKVKPCSRAYSHDWTECPFVHPGENARRRDPRKYHYSCVPCPDFRKGSCRNGDACEYAHGVFESWLHPAQYRTRLCKDEIGCNRRVCFFAHKPEELRPLYNSSCSPGSVASSPRSTVNLPPLDLNAAAAAILMNQAPMSPSSSAALAAAVWLNQNTGGAMTTPTAAVQLQSSRLKSALSARDMDLELELLALDGYHHQQQLLQQQKLIDEIGGDLFGSPDTTLMSPLKNLSLMKQSSAVSQFSSPSALQKQLLSGYTTSGGNLRSSPPVPRSSSPSLGFDNNSIPPTLINSRASAFAKRSQSFIDRGALNRQPTNSQIAATNKSPSPGFSDWGSPTGKLDWRIHGEELNKLRKSASFGIRANSTNIGGGAPGFASPATADEPDLPWMQSIGNGYDVNHQIRQQQKQQNEKIMMMMMNKKQQQFNLNSGADEFHPGDIFASSWSDQLCFEQEQLVA